ncbi:hypothetical protein N7462_004265 [Penicillium macrosclerotiorum]|uniref:uncharacterized protein n=1 Tax=Penicillium macrosclerotiorum TaxID=303699 RepID=UPI0025484A48|nr:uncharacterized protein N7462_004265 [Penicillium macrosclerotiorum]KAJ5689873.1 hypothetical protein N7462_004265 [Penicillium macrosclerotiorum]
MASPAVPGGSPAPEVVAGPVAASTVPPQSPPDSPTGSTSTLGSSLLDYNYYSSPPRSSSSQVLEQHSSPVSGHHVQLRRKPVPSQHANLATANPAHPSSPLSIEDHKPSSPILPPANNSPQSPFHVDGDNSFISVPRNPNRYSRGRHPANPLRIDTAASSAFLRSVTADEDDDDDDDDEVADYFDEAYEHQFTHGIGTPLHSRLVSEPFIPILNSPPPTQRRPTSMALHPPINRPPPLHIDIDGRSMSMPLTDPRQPKTPGNKISSFFGWKAATATATSPGAESSSTEISDSGRSPLPSPMPPLANVPIAMKPSSPYDTKAPGFGPPVRTSSLGGVSTHDAMFTSKIADLENELREISSELAGSIRREMELEDLIERFQTEGPEVNRRTSDYFSDSGTSSIRYAPDRQEDIEKIRRAAEQERAQLKVEMSQRLQEERTRRTASESHVQILENQVQQLRRDRTDVSDLSSKTKELETALENTRRKLLEERQSKDNFEDLLTAMRVELEQLRNERDVLREGVAPAVDSSEMQRLLEEIEALKIENASLAQLQGSRFASIAEEEGVSAKRNSAFGLSRSNSLARKPAGGLARSGSLSRSNSVSGGKDRESRESLFDKVKDIEAQRDALHRTLKSLLDRQLYQARDFEKRTRIMEIELAQARESGPPRKLGYEREVRLLREDVNHLRFRAEDALDAKWQCEKNLAGLKMDLDRAEQETGSLRVLLQQHDTSTSDDLDIDTDPESFAKVVATSTSLETIFQQLLVDRQQAEADGAQSDELAAAITRTDALGSRVNLQLQMNSSLRRRLEDAIDKGERDQHLSVERINVLQNQLKETEDNLLFAQQHCEDEMGKHEDEIRQLKENQSAQLMRMKNGGRTPVSLSPRPPNTPFAGRSPRLDKTTSGDGVPLADVVQAEVLERRVKDLEKLLRDADMEMEEVVSRMNRAQVDVAQLQSDRDEAIRQTHYLQADIQTERDTLRGLM